MGLAGILLALGLLIWLSFRGWSILLLAPAAALVAAATSGEPLLAHWTQTFMVSAAGFLAQFFPAVSSRRPVRQADGGQRLGRSHCALHDREAGHGPRRARGGAGRGHRHLWRGEPVRGDLCARSHGARTVPGGRHPTPDHAGGNRARHHDFHHVGAARNPGPAKRHPHAVLWHHAVRGAWPRHHRRCDHARIRPRLARPRRARGAACG